MILENLNAQISEMKDVFRLEQIKKNKATQDKINQQYNEKLNQVHALMFALRETGGKLSFRPKQGTLDTLNKLVTVLKGVLYNGIPTAERLVEVNPLFKSVETSVRMDWKAHFEAITANPIRILHIAKAVAPAKCVALIDGIHSGSEWTTVPNGYAQLIRALKDSSEVIQSMKVDDEVMHFLEQMNNGRATVADLTPKVAAWLQEQSLMTKIHLSFISI